MPPFTYEALPPADIEFVPLKQTRSFRADELMQVLDWFPHLPLIWCDTRVPFNALPTGTCAGAVSRMIAAVPVYTSAGPRDLLVSFAEQTGHAHSDYAPCIYTSSITRRRT